MYISCGGHIPIWRVSFVVSDSEPPFADQFAIFNGKEFDRLSQPSLASRYEAARHPIMLAGFHNAKRVSKTSQSCATIASSPSVNRMQRARLLRRSLSRRAVNRESCKTTGNDDENPLIRVSPQN